jgi:hypothetical protein
MPPGGFCRLHPEESAAASTRGARTFLIWRHSLSQIRPNDARDRRPTVRGCT